MTYTRLTTWADNVKNCHIDESRAVMISDEPFNADFIAFEAGIKVSRLGIKDKTFMLKHCGKWHWIDFDNESDAIAFKLVWEQ